MGRILVRHGGVAYQANSKLNCDREQFLLVISDYSLEASVQGLQLGLVAELEKVWTDISIYNARRAVTILTLDKFADLWGNAVSNWTPTS